MWRTHGLDKVLAEALRDGVVLSGVSAGMNCWFGSAYDGESQRRPAYLSLVGNGLPGGYAACDGVGRLLTDGRLSAAVSSRPEA